MAQKKKPGIINTLLSTALLVPRLLMFAGNLKQLIQIEARLTARSIFTMLVLSLVMTALLTTIWICLLAMLGVYFHSLQWTVISILAVIFLLNVILLFIIGIMMLKTKKYFGFPETLHHLNELKLF